MRTIYLRVSDMRIIDGIEFCYQLEMLADLLLKLYIINETYIIERI